MPLVDGNSSDAAWPLANTYQGKNFALLANDADIDKRVAAYLLVSGVLFGKFSTETLKQVDWQSLCEAAAAENESLKETNSAQAQKISALEAELSALKLRCRGITAKI